MIITRKKIILSVCAIAFLIAGVFVAQGVFDYFDYKKTVQAASGMPWQDGGTITVYIPACTPINCVPVCAGQSQITYMSQILQGPYFMCVPVPFIYKGGGVIPIPGMDIIAGGVTNITPWVVGIPSVSASRIQKIADVFKLIIAGIKE